MNAHFVPSSSQKNTAVVLGATGNLAFALGVVLKGLKRHNQKLLEEADVIVYYQNMDETAREALGRIIPCRFVPYKFPHMAGMRPHVLRDYGEMTFVRYECFRFLKNYKYVMWLDADILIQGDISGMRGEIPHGIGFRREYYDERVRVTLPQTLKALRWTPRTTTRALWRLPTACREIWTICPTGAIKKHPKSANRCTTRTRASCF